MKRELNLYILDILESIKSIEEFSKDLTKEKLSKDDLRQSAIIRKIEIIGESVKNFPSSFKEKYPEIPWKDIAGIRDVIIHGYFRVDLNTIWKVIKEDLPDLKNKILKIKKDLEGNENKEKNKRVK